MRRKDTISYLGVWETLHNPNFKSIEFDAIKQERLHKLNQIAIQQMTVLENLYGKINKSL